MPAYTAKFSREQRKALFRAVLGENMSVRGALDAAAAGQLPELGVEQQRELATMNYSYACQLVNEERDNRDGVQRARSQPNSVTKDAAVALLRRAQKDALKIANAKKPLMDADAAQKTLGVIEKAQRVLAGLEVKKAPAKPAAKTETSKPRGLAEQIARGSSAEPDDLPTETTTGEAHAPARNSETNEQADVSMVSAAREDVALVA